MPHNEGNVEEEKKKVQRKMKVKDKKTKKQICSKNVKNGGWVLRHTSTGNACGCNIKTHDDE